METYRGRSISVVKDLHIEGSWTPETPVKPNVARPSPIYDDGQGGLLAQAWEEREAYLSRYTQQNNEAQTLLSYSISSAERSRCPTTSNNIWDGVHGTTSLSGNIQLQRENGEIQRQGLEEYLPHWSSQGRKSVMSYGSSDLASVSYPIYDSWDSMSPWKNNGVRENGSILERNINDFDFNTMSFGDLLNINESLTLRNNGNTTSYGMFSPGWGSQPQASKLSSGQLFNNQEALRRINPQMDRLYSQGMQNDAFPGPFWSTSDPNSLPSNKHANGSSVVAPATPDTWQRLQSYVASENTPPGINQGVNEQKVLQEHEDAAKMIEIQDDHNKNVSGPITDSSPDNVSITVEEDQNIDTGGNQGIDLNNTPQKKPRRRRYQPKVIRENKPKRTPKPKTPKPTETQVKRKYVRKNKTNTPTISPEESTEPKPTEPKTAEPPVKSCRRSLNFDLNGQVTEHSSLHMSNGSLEAEPKASECQETGNESNHPVHLRQTEELMFKTSMTAYDLNLTQNQELKEYISLPVMENLDSSQIDINISIGEKVKSADSLSEKKAQSSTRKDSRSAQSPNSSPCASSSEGAQTRGLKRSISYTAEPTLIDVEIGTISKYTPWLPNHLSPKITHTEEPHQSLIPEICKRKRTEKSQRSYIQTTSSVAASEDISQVGKDHGQPQVELTASKYYCCNSTAVGISGVSNNHAVLIERSENRYQLMKTWADLSRLKKKKRTKGATQVRDLAPLTRIASVAKGARRKKADSVSGPSPCHATLNGVVSCTGASASETKTSPGSKRRSKKQDSVNKNWDIVPYNPPATEATGSIEALPWRKRRCSIEKLTQLLQQLDINREKRKISRKEKKSIVPYQVDRQEQNALVLYEKDGSLVPFEGPFNPISKRRQRAKVHLDDETTRVWRLLLENIDNEGINGTDEEKAKWWENERSVFQGRVDSFIARMRLVQGDRRFTPWKGSVLDSVIGVFLTQNVSDHLSSSAFMSMAARFPLKPESTGSTLSEESTSALFVEPEISIIEPEESITWNEKIIDPPTLDKNSRAIFYFDHSEEKEVVNSREETGKASPVSPTQCFSETCQKSSSYSRGCNANSQTTETETVYLQGEDKARDDATSSQQSIISSQNSTNSPNQQTVGIMNTFSESNSRTQAVTSSSKFNCLDHTASFMGLLKMAEGNIHNQAQLQYHLEDMKHVTEYYPEAHGVSSSNYQLNLEAGFHLQDTQGLDMLEVESRSSDMSRKDENSPQTEQSNLTSEISDQEKFPDSFPKAAQNMSSCYILEGDTMIVQSQRKEVKEPLDTIASSARAETSPTYKGINVPFLSQEMTDVIESIRALERTSNNSKEDEQIHGHNYTSGVVTDMANTNPSKTGKGKPGKGKKNEFDWDSLRREAQVNGKKPERPANTRDSLDWEAVRHANVNDIAETIKERGMNNVLAGRIKDLLDRLVKDHGSIEMEWLRDIPPDKAKEYLLSFRGLGLKSVECVRLLTLHHLAFPVDTNVGRIAVRLGWVPLQPLPESLQLHLLEMYPILESIQQYLWPRLCKLDQKTLYELHYHMITFGKVFCTKRQPNCNACPLRGECRHFASAFASARFSLPGPEERSIMPASGNTTPHVNPRAGTNLLSSKASWDNHNPHSNSESYGTAIVQGPSFPLSLTLPHTVHLERKSINTKCEPIVEVPASPEQEPQEQALCDIEDAFYEDPNEIPTINLNMKEFTETLQNFMLQETGMSNALVALNAEAASIPTPKLKNINRLRTEHHVYELPDTHPLLHGLEKREPDDPCSYLLAIWTPGETANSIDPPARRCCSDDPSMLCNEETCSYCSSQREADSQTVRGTLLIPTRTAMRGSFPLNGTYFQVNEVFADHDSSLNPIAVPRSWLWNLPRRTVYFGTSIPTIFKGLTTEDIQHCFWRGYVCVRGFDQKTRAPRPLMARLHFPASRIQRGAKGKAYDE